ncbi:MAG: glycosyltransferase [Planctomycetia bacterium]
MQSWQWAALALYGLILAAAAARHVLVSHAVAVGRFLRPTDPRLPAERSPFVSIVVPAKDEAGAIECCVRSLMRQNYPCFEIVVVDDRSTDATPDIVRRLATEDSRVRLLQITELPPGWTGKCHALHVARRHVRGEWMLFVDADTELHPSCVAVTTADAVLGGFEMESMLVALRADTFWEAVVQPFAGICLIALFPVSRVNDPKALEAGFANGQFILIHTACYDAVGGHEAVRDKFVEDVHLGRLVKRSGRPMRVAYGADVVAVRMYTSFDAIIRGWSRIFYSSVDCKPGKLYFLIASILLFSGLSYVVLPATAVLIALGDRDPFTLSLFAFGFVHELLQTTVMARIYHLSKSKMWSLWYRPLAVFVTLRILARAVRLCSTHQVDWRGTTYDRSLQQVGSTPSASSEAPTSAGS